MDDTKVRTSLETHVDKRNRHPVLNPAFNFLVQFPQRLQNSLKSHFKRSLKNDCRADIANPMLPSVREPDSTWEIDLEKQLQAWKENPSWVDQPPEIKVSVPKGSLCKLNVKLKVGLPPDAIYNIVIDPENKRVFKNIKEVISRKVLVNEGSRQVVEVEQAALWRFLWWSGTISVHVFVDQNRKDHSVKFRQAKSGFMKKFEGCWRVEPLFIDEHSCFPHQPKTLADYEHCTQGKGRVGSIVSLDQLIQPALVPPPPISWYLRGITTRTTEMLINDLLAEAERLRGAAGGLGSREELEASDGKISSSSAYDLDDIKRRWGRRRRCMRRH